MLKQLRLKFILINMLLVTLMLVGIFGTVLHFTRQNLEREGVELLRQIAAEPTLALRTAGVSGGKQTPCFVLQTTPFGEVVAMSNGYFDLSDTEMLRGVLLEAAGTQRETGVLSAYGLRFLRASEHGLPLYVFADVTGEETMLRSLLRTCLLIGAFSFLAFFGVSLLLARWAIRPVEEAWTEQKQFVADASHELKTPLTVIMTNAELMGECPPEESAQCTENILVMARQMRGLVESLLELARLENGTAQQAAAAEFDLSRMTAEALLPFEPVCFERGLTLCGELEPGIFVRGCEAQLRQLLEILLDNAQKYAEPPGEVTVRLRRQGRSHCLLSVSDPGAPIPPEELPKLFRRFYRADRARAMDHSYGLGLSIAQRLTDAHHGKIYAESAGGFNTFCVSLPALPAPESR